jgi:putative ATP-binding cassette transporter
LQFIWRLGNLVLPYWRSEERWRARALLVAIVALALGLVFINVQLNEWNRDFYNALDQRQFDLFTQLLIRFAVLAALYIVGAVLRLYLTQMLEMHWRTWLTRDYLSRWLHDRAYYRLELEGRGQDNPDQRIAVDLQLLTTGTLTLGLGLLSSVVTLASFIAILWSISGPLTFSLGATDITIPGYMVWVAIVYAVVGSGLAHLVGRPLIPLNFLQERYEADFRFGLVRLRENAEGVALYHGEDSERTGLLTRFENIRQNWWALMRYTKNLTSFTVGYAQIAIIFPILVAAPRYFAGAISLGELFQISQAFGQVQDSLSWFVENYGELASYRASVERLLTFQHALDETARAAAEGGLDVTTNAVPELSAGPLELAIPSGEVILTSAGFVVEPADRILVSGPSGSGKSTLFRAIAGIWPFGKGQIHVPEHARVLFLPQKPYIPIGTLRAAVSYPGAPGTFDDSAIREALEAVRLGSIANRLDDTENWSLQLSGGEQQRLAVARVLLHQPDWLFLDEATGALDETTEREIYKLIQKRLPNTAILSVAHRSALAAYHAKRFDLVPADCGRAELVISGE